MRHTPRFLEDSWIVCNSINHELLQINVRTQVVQRRLKLNSWTRGLAIADDVLIVGESAGRHDPNPAATASIAIIDRMTWTVLDRVYLPCREVYDLVFVPLALLQGVRLGFRTNLLRVAEQDQRMLFDQIGVQPARLWATGDPLPPDACRVNIQATLPTVLHAQTEVEVSCTVTNRGTAALVSAPPNPVNLSYKWIDPTTKAPVAGIEGKRTRLSSTLHPQQARDHLMKLQVPQWDGTLILRITLVQEMVAWFDDVHPTNAWSQEVQILRGDAIRTYNATRGSSPDSVNSEPGR